MQTPLIDSLLMHRPGAEEAVLLSHSNSDEQALLLATLVAADGDGVSVPDLIDATGLAQTQIYRLQDTDPIGSLLRPVRGRGIALDSAAYQLALEKAVDYRERTEETFRTIGESALENCIALAVLPDRSDITNHLNTETVTQLLAYAGLPLQHRHFMRRYIEQQLLPEGQRDRNFGRRMQDLRAKPLFREIVATKKAQNHTAHRLSLSGLLIAYDQGLLAELPPSTIVQSPSGHGKLRAERRSYPGSPKPRQTAAKTQPVSPAPVSETPPPEPAPLFHDVSEVLITLPQQELAQATEWLDALESCDTALPVDEEERALLDKLGASYLDATGRRLFDMRGEHIRLSRLARRAGIVINLAAA